ncbi:MAG TPA: HU family DNA-binding protein [Candidatus Wirthbacteria bacterium]|nr:HU family DNA-binding protein [Candidatus Wirthbacteria bacterium]
MNKTELIDYIASQANITKKAASDALAAMIGAVSTQLKKGNKVQITGFGTFVVRDRKARTGRNPRTGAAIQIPATKSPAFVAGKGLKDAVK